MAWSDTHWLSTVHPAYSYSPFPDVNDPSLASLARKDTKKGN
jgi:hypothetical protein